MHLVKLNVLICFAWTESTPGVHLKMTNELDCQQSQGKIYCFCCHGAWICGVKIQWLTLADSWIPVAMINTKSLETKISWIWIKYLLQTHFCNAFMVSRLHRMHSRYCPISLWSDSSNTGKRGWMIIHPKRPQNCICSLCNAHTALDAGISRGLKISSEETEKGKMGRNLNFLM